MAKELKPLTIYAPSIGIAPSPHNGYGDCRNLDIFSVPGAIKLNNALALKSGGTVVGLIKWMVINPATPAEVYALDDGGKVYKSANSGNTWSLMTGFTAGGHGNGLAIFKNYLIVARDAYLDVCGDGTSTGIANANWSNSWQAIDSDVLWHPMLVSDLDGKLYGGGGRYVFTLEENSGQTFAPGTGATFTYTQQALDLPANYRIKSLEELGNNLMCGTWQGTNIYDFKIAHIFPWDGTSTTYGQPIKIYENGCNGLKTDGSYMYVLAGIEGIVYKSNGVDAWPIAQIPQSIADLSGGKYLEPYPGAIIKYKGRIFFGVSGGGTGTIPGMGVYSLKETSKGTIIAHEHTVSSGDDGTSYVCKIGSLLGITRDTLLVGWRSGTTPTYGIDKTDTSAYQTGYTAYFDSPLYRVGSNLQKRQFSQIDILLAQELAANEGIRIQYRVNLTDSWTTIGTYIYSGTVTATTEIIGAVISHNAIADIPDCELLQIRVLPTGTTTTPTFKLLELK